MVAKILVAPMIETGGTSIPRTDALKLARDLKPLASDSWLEEIDWPGLTNRE
jgi:hypothetical protein